MMFLCSLSIIASATDYFVSSSGNDSANGLSSSTPWRSIEKVNSEFTRFTPGDRILFKRGDVFYGTISVSRAGMSGNPILIGAFGTGQDPVICGFATISGWTNTGEGIFSKVLSCESNPNILLLDGKNTAKGRWPNTEWRTIDSHYGSTSLTDNELPGSPAWTGAEIVVRTYASLVDRSIISNHSGQTLIYSALTQDPVNGSGYFIQNHRATLDSYGEWCYTDGILYMYFGSENPENHEVKVSYIDNLVKVDVNYVTIENLHLEGANINGVYINYSDYVSVRNCLIEYGGQNGIMAEVGSDHLVIDNNTINNNNNIGILLDGNLSVNNTVSNNNVRYSGYLLGMGGNGYFGYCGIINDGTNSLTTYNKVEYSGFCAIKFGGQNSEVSYNYINYCDLCKDDGAGIYTWRDYTTGKVVKYNIIFNSLARPDGWHYYELVRSHGIYMDGTFNVTLSHNTAAHNDGCGIYINAAQSITTEYNTCYDNIWGLRVLSEPGRLARNNNVNNNILFAKVVPQPSNEWNQSAFGVVTLLDESDLPQFGTTDYNYFIRPINNDNYIDVWKNAWGWAPGDREYYNLSEWQSKYGKDGHSSTTPITVSDTNKIRFEYNTSKSNKIVSLGGSYIDAMGAKYSGTITLLPFTSSVLMVDPNPSAPPAAPVYVSSAIENAAPSVIELTYNLTLANIVPTASAFTVQVNSVVRSVTSVTVSGTKVLLTLSSPVAYGNAVTVAYTAPSSGQLQTSAGGLAGSVSAQSVTNRVNTPPVPIFSGAAVENAAPSVIEMTYSLALASIVPAVSSFMVQMNSAARSISSVSVSGTKVMLTLATPVVYGDNVTVAYTKPASNPLQTSEGGQASSISAQTVSNKVNAVVTPPVVITPPVVVPNTPPVAVVNYVNGTYSGFVGELNASGSYDADKDNLLFTWKVPNNISVSGINSSVIEFLAPIVDVKQIYDFTLTVSDGKTSQSKTIPVEILPYRPGLETAEVISIEAGDYQTPYLPYNAIDGNIGTMWSAIGGDQWIILELKGYFNIQHIKVAFQPGQKKESYFDVLGSNDKENWEPVLTKSKSCAFSGDLQVFEFPPSKTEKEFRYVKLVGQGNSLDSWNYISELRIFGYKHKNPSNYEDLIVKIYPNPAHEMVNILIDEPTFNPDFIKIVSLTGKVLYNVKVDPGIRQLQVPVNLRQGVYIVQMGIDEMTMFTQKLVVSR